MSFSDRAKRLRFRCVALCAAVLAAYIALAVASPSPLSAQGSILAMSQAQTAQFEARLNLTDSQKQAVRPIVTRGLREGEAIMKKHGINPGAGKKPGLFQLVSLDKETKGVNQWVRAQLSKILSPVQMREYDKFVAERREAIRKQLLG